MTSITGHVEGAVLARVASSATFDEAPPLFVASPLRRVAVVLGDLIEAAAVALCVPFVILAVGTPIVLCVRLLLWVGEWL
jgi:hypothetical protein